MKKTISNEFLTLTIDSQGAQLVSIKTADGIERLWSGDPSVWNYQAPILFPWCGRMTNLAFTHEGKTYEGTPHGFLRNTEHQILPSAHDDAPTITFCKKSDAMSRNLFPFDFTFEQTFSLNGPTITHAVRVINTGSTTLPFGLGYHPGFLCPFSAEKTAADYSIIFNTPQTPHLVLMEAGHPIGTTEEYMRNNDKIKLSNTIFENDSLCLTNLTAKSITLQEEGTKNSIEFDIDGFPYVLLWSAPTETLRFICIEPWHTLPDLKDAPSEWSQKKNLLHLPSGNIFNSHLNMTFNYE